MESEQSRPFFNPEKGEPYELSESPSDSEVSYSAEIEYTSQFSRPLEWFGMVWLHHSVDQDGNTLPFLSFDKSNIRDGLNYFMGRPNGFHNGNGLTVENINELIKAHNDWVGDGVSLQPLPYPWNGDYVHSDSANSRNQSVIDQNNARVNYYDGVSAESYDAESKPRLSEKQLWSLNVMKTMYYWHGDAYVEVDNRGHKTFTSRPVQGLLNKGLIEIPRDRIRNPRFWGRVESYESYNVDLTPLAWEYDYTWPWPSHYSIKNSSNIRQEGNKMVSDKETAEAEGKVRTMSGKPHTPRKLVKDKNITPKDASKKLKLEAESGQMCEVCYGNDDLPYDSDHFTECGRCGKSVCMDCDGEMEYHPDWFKVCGECDTILENVSIHGADELVELVEYCAKPDPCSKCGLCSGCMVESYNDDGVCETCGDYFSADEETVVDKTEESGITTETRQYKKKKYNPDKMKTDIPADVLNQTDSDDFWVAFSAGILGIGIGASIHKIYENYGNPFKSN